MSRSLAVVALVALIACAAAAKIEEEDNVLVLTDSNFEEAIKTHDTLLVEFYAPWCGHCKSLAPEYAKAAKALKKDGFSIAKMDATANTETPGQFGVEGFPTLKFFRNGKASDYTGGRVEADIVSWVKKKAGPAAKTVSTQAEADAFKASAEVVVIGIFAAADDANAKAFLSVAAGNDEVPFALTTSTDIATAYGVTAPSVVLFKEFDEGRADFTAAIEEEALNTFISANVLPLVVPFSQKNAPKIFGGNIKSHLLVFAEESSKGYDDLLKEVSAVAKEVKGKLLTVSVGKGNERVLEYFGVKAKDQPTAAIVNMPAGGSMKKFLLGSKDVSQAALSTFANNYLDGKLKPFLKSEEPSEKDLAGPVKVVVGKTFESIALDNTKDVLLEFYAPWCGHCKTLAPIYEELGELFAPIKSIVIAKIDATANEVDHPDVNVQGFPTLKFFPAGSTKVVDYEGARDLAGLTAFLKENAAIKFTLPGDDNADDNDEL